MPLMLLMEAPPTKTSEEMSLLCIARWLRCAISRRILADFAEIGAGGVIAVAGFFLWPADGLAGFRDFAEVVIGDFVADASLSTEPVGGIAVSARTERLEDVWRF